MERYSRIGEGKFRSRYSEEFKRKICEEYLEGHDGQRALEKKYKLGNSRLSSWLKSFGIGVKKTIYLPSPIMPAKKEPDLNPGDESVRVLKKQLEYALLEKELYPLGL